jgi:glucan biosynthesis protein C
MRRYDIDWLRVIAIFLLLIYHVAIGFQPWGVMIGFITSKEPWGSLWIPMTMLNVWRIPLLFLVSGMGVYFAMQKRTWKQLLVERSRRIFLPLLFGVVVVVPLGAFIWQRYYNMDIFFPRHPGHLWFLANIFAYVLLLSPLFYALRRHEHSPWVNSFKRILSTPLSCLLVAAVFVAEVLITKPYPYELYAMTWHGFILGLVAFFFGFSFVLAGEPFWSMIKRWRWAFAVPAVGMFVVRAFYLGMKTPAYLIAIESAFWIMAVIAFCSLYLNRPSAALSYLSRAVLPVYIVHILFIHFASLLIFPLDMDIRLKFAVVLILTVGGCFAFYEMVIRRIRILWPLFGMK